MGDFTDSTDFSQSWVFLFVFFETRQITKLEVLFVCVPIHVGYKAQTLCNAEIVFFWNLHEFHWLKFEATGFSWEGFEYS